MCWPRRCEATAVNPSGLAAPHSGGVVRVPRAAVRPLHECREVDVAEGGFPILDLCQREPQARLHPDLRRQRLQCFGGCPGRALGLRQGFTLRFVAPPSIRMCRVLRQRPYGRELVSVVPNAQTGAVQERRGTVGQVWDRRRRAIVTTSIERWERCLLYT